MKKTIDNLAKAFIGESQARNRYTFYAKTAKKEKLPQISTLFTITAENEAQHAKWLLRMINDLLGKSEQVKVEAEMPTVFENTAANLKAAIAGEHYETTEMYPEFAKVAREEGLDKIADRLLAIANAEKHHEERYITLLENLENGTLFKKEESKTWVCLECGYTHDGKSPPEECSSCSHPMEHFMIKCEEY